MDFSCSNWWTAQASVFSCVKRNNNIALNSLRELNENNACHRKYSIDYSVHFSSVAQLCPALCDPMDCSMPGFPVHHQFPEPAQTHVNWLLVSVYIYPFPTVFQQLNMSYGLSSTISCKYKYVLAFHPSNIFKLHKYTCSSFSNSIIKRW